MLLGQRARLVRSAGAPVAWLSLDDEDNDSGVLWSGILAACARAARGLNAPVADALTALSVPAAAVGHGFARAFFDTIEPLPQVLWLVLDDVHEIVAKPALSVLAFMLKSMPPGLRLMLGSRHDPPLPLPRLLLDGTAAEIRAADLAFDRDEARELLSGHGVQLTDPDLDLLLARTEGWAAGLRLAALALTEQDDASKYVATLAGDDRPVADYLVSEVLAHQSADMMAFLLATAVPDVLTIELANELSGRSDAGAILEQLAHDNALLHRSGSAPRTYRYHALLRSYLLAELDRRDAEAERGIHRTASDWFAGHGAAEVALEHAVKASDWGRVSTLVTRHGLGLLLTGGGQRMSRTLLGVPLEVVAEPAVPLVAAAAALCNGELALAGRRIDHVGRDPAVHADPQTRLLHAATLVCEARLRRTRPPALLEVLEKNSDASGNDATLELFAIANRGMLRMLLGEFPESEADLTEALRLARQTGAEFLVLECLSHLAVTAAARCDFGSIAARAGEAIEFAAAHGWAASGRLKPTYLAAAWAAWQTLDLAQAERFLALAMAIDADVEPEAEFAAAVVKAIVDFENGTDRRRTLARLRSLWADAAPDVLTPANVYQFCLVEVPMALSIAEPGWATEAANRAERLVGDGSDVAVMRAWINVHHGRERPARQALGPVVLDDAGCQLVSSEIAAWLLEAHIADANDEPSRAHGAILRAIELAAPRRAMRDVANASARAWRLLVRGQGRYGVHDEFVHDVLVATEREPVRTAGLGAVSGEALTARELELLRELPSLLSLDEIAMAHVVSVNTVKTHLKALYRKLDVRSRRSAVERARELGIL